MLKKIKDKFSRKKWIIYLFYNGICIKKLKINDISEIDTTSIVVFNHKELFGNRLPRLVVKPTRLLKTDEEKKKTYWGVVFEKGVDM